MHLLSTFEKAAPNRCTHLVTVKERNACIRDDRETRLDSDHCTWRGWEDFSSCTTLSCACLMLVLFETALGYCLFKVSDNVKLEDADLYKNFESPEGATKLYVHLNDFSIK